MKSRFWWTRTDIIEDANFVWTQLKNKQVLDLMPTFASKLEKDVNPVVFDSKIPKAILNENQENFGFKLISESHSYLNLTKGYFLVAETLKAHNRLPNNSCICNKKGMFKNLKAYYDTIGLNVFEKVPLTFHIETGTSDPQFQTFTQQFTEGSTWIIKPGEATNRGKGIKVSSFLDQIKDIISKHQENRTYIIQKYIQNPLLINKRKFDIRCYALITSFSNQLQGYFFKDGYLRTSCKEFNIKNTNDKFIHLTNDAIQKNHEDYGKFESGNKLSYYDFQKFLHSNGSNIDFFIDIFPQIVEIIKESIACAKDIINEECKMNAFEVLGYDFMIDSEYKVWLIEVNTNPCLELSCSYLSKIIPDMLENSFRIALDPMFPPPENHKKFKTWVKNSNLTNKYMLVYSSLSAN
jgi:tubulin--tyrosine ligase